MRDSRLTWRSVTLGDLCLEGGGGIQTGPFGSQLHAYDYVPVGIPSVMPQNIGDNVIDEDGIARITEADATRLERYRLSEGDIVYSRRGDVEKRALVRAEHNGWLCGTGCLRVRLGDRGKHDSRFISYLLGVPETREWISQHAVGATMPNLNTKILSSVPLTVPNLDEQQAIAEVLGALDDKIAANTRLVGNLDELFITRWRQVDNHAAARKHSLDSMVLDSIGGDWGVERATPTFTEAVYCIRGADISSLQESGLGKMPIRHIKSTSLERRKTRDGDIVVEMSGGSPTQSTGRAALISDHLIKRLGRPIVSSNFCRVLRLQDSTYSHFIYAMLRWDWTIGEFFQFENGSTGIKNLAFKEYSARKLVPSLTSGDLSSFNFEADALLAYAHAAGEETERLIATRDALLPQLMSGKLRVKDAEKVLEGVL